MPRNADNSVGGLGPTTFTSPENATNPLHKNLCRDTLDFIQCVRNDDNLLNNEPLPPPTKNKMVTSQDHIPINSSASIPISNQITIIPVDNRIQTKVGYVYSNALSSNVLTLSLYQELSRYDWKS